MTTSTTIHHCTNVKTDGVDHYNSNAINLTVHTNSHWGTLSHTITLFDLPTHIADGINDLLSGEGIKENMTEAEIRADERKKVCESIIQGSGEV